MTVCMFPGQGSKARGMGRDLFAPDPALVDAASEILGYSIKELCLDDPRRDVPEAWRTALIATHSTPERIAILSLARNLRILGIFHRLARTKSPHYRSFQPRTRALILRALDEVPDLRAPVTELLDRTALWVEGGP